ncbi:hypothetical protein CXG81DRAFT_11812 [Caulochytrium protostelioides]|uniref:Uncharacterized protein n=1 Tax=Caulochytrium protostelioides TaxID=1555241 RepID=A0A4P9X8F0_9FUNG|nr:hypothetical protein CXG81DRAFT_11812 [Caulochytrium protostelioides]|eukprot:RKP01567.1 hypothetical protein CXG81DRAFT_11812 [Caulochytrium protostelioides]
MSSTASSSASQPNGVNGASGESTAPAGAAGKSLPKPPYEVLHVGWPGTLRDAKGAALPESSLTPEVRADLRQKLREQGCDMVLGPTQLMRDHYDGYCKQDLWPVFHYILWDANLEVEQRADYWDAYYKVNELFAECVVENYVPGDTIWVHDYHLLLVPALVHKRIPDATIGLFLHTPFPSSEIFRCLPRRKEILQGMLGANLISFQTYSYSRHFISSCTRVLGLESTPKGVDYAGTLVAVTTLPIGIDVDHVKSRLNDPAVMQKIKTIKEMYADKLIIIGRDKLDHIKGVQHKLNAFEKFLTLYPEWQNKVVLIQVTTPPQRESPKLESKVADMVSRINGTFGSLKFAPVHYHHQRLEQDEYYGLLSIADIGLITSVRDGMNTTSHEFTVCQENSCGTLILSEFTGTAGSLSAAMLVNPWDYVGVASAIDEALRLSMEERRLKHRQLMAHVMSHTAATWSHKFIRELHETVQMTVQSSPTAPLEFDRVCNVYRGAKHRLLLFDYDGTLTPIQKTPGAAVPSQQMIDAMRVLTADPRNMVFVISGRDQQFLEHWLGSIPRLGLSAEHGCFIKYPDENARWINLGENLDFSWKQEVQEIFDYYTERTQGSFVETKECAMTWHYRMADPEYGLFQAKECQNHLENAITSKLPIEIMVGKKNLEVRHIAMNKGEIVKRLLAAHPETDFVFCAGDDKTDEDMFRSLKRVPPGGAAGSSSGPAVLDTQRFFTCTIGPASKKTLANWHMPDPHATIDLITRMAEETKALMASEVA